MISVTLLGARLEFDAASAMENQNSRAFSDAICRVPGQRDAALVSFRAEFFGRCCVAGNRDGESRDTP
jgi:hypothetical protein